MSNEFVSKASDMIRQLINEEGGIERKHLEVLKKQADEIYYATTQSTTKEYMGLHHLVSGYIYLLETGCSADEAFEFIMKTYDLTEQFISENKSRYNWHLKNTVKAGDEHLKQRQMLRRGTMDRNVLTTAKTPNQQYRRLSRQVKLHDKIVEEENKNKELIASLIKKQGEVAMAHKELSDRQIEDIIHSNNFATLSDKEKARVLADVGWTREQIAEKFGKTVRTVHRWLAP